MFFEIENFSTKIYTTEEKSKPEVWTCTSSLVRLLNSLIIANTATFGKKIRRLDDLCISYAKYQKFSLESSKNASAYAWMLIKHLNVTNRIWYTVCHVRYVLMKISKKNIFLKDSSKINVWCPQTCPFHLQIHLFTKPNMIMG